MVSNMIFFI